MKFLTSLLTLTLFFGLTTESRAAHDELRDHVVVCNPHRVARTSHELDRASNHFARLLTAITGYSHLSRDAEDLALEASHLHRSAELGGHCEHLRRDFQLVANAMRHLRQQIRLAHDIHHNAHVMMDFRDVEVAFRSVRDSLSGGVLPPAVYTVNVVCQSGGYHTTVCPVAGRVLNAAVAVQLSHSRCEVGRSFGWSGNSIWASRGCRANFLVTVAR